MEEVGDPHGFGDEQTGLYNRDGLALLADHHMRMADRSGLPVAFVFVELDDPDLTDGEAARMGSRAIQAAQALKRATRASDVLARIARGSFCVLLTGDADGAEDLVLSRLVEAISAHNARAGRPADPLSLSVGTAAYDPRDPCSFEELMARALADMAERRARGPG